MMFIAVTLLLAAAVLATRTGPPKPRRSMVACEFFSCPPNDLSGNALTVIGEHHGTGDLACDYSAIPTDSNSCYYNPITGVQQPSPESGGYYSSCVTTSSSCVAFEVCDVAWTCPMYDGAAATYVAVSDTHGAYGPYYSVILQCGYNGAASYPSCDYDAGTGMLVGGDPVCPLRAGCTDIEACDFFPCPPQDLNGNALTVIGSDSGTGDLACDYSAIPTDANSCYYNPNTGVLQPSPESGGYYSSCVTTASSCVPTEVCGVAWTCPMYDGAAATSVDVDDTHGAYGPYYSVILLCGYNGPASYPSCNYDAGTGMLVGGDPVCPLRAGCTDIITRRELEHRKRVAAEDASRDALPFPENLEDARQPW